MSRLTCRLLGPPRLEADGKPVKINRRKAVGLLAFLAVTRESCSRESLLALFWPDHGRSDARAELRRTLSVLKKALGQDVLAIDRQTAGIAETSELWTDAIELRRLLAASKDHDHGAIESCDECLSLLSDALQLYKGDFLAGFYLRDSAEFDDWQQFQSESLRKELCSALDGLAAGMNARGRHEEAISYAKRRLSLDPLDESSHCQLMRVYAASGQRSAALRQFGACARVLEAELDAEPEEETTQLYDSIKSGQSAPPRPINRLDRKRPIAPKIQPGPKLSELDEIRIVTVLFAAVDFDQDESWDSRLQESTRMTAHSQPAILNVGEIRQIPDYNAC